MMKKLAVLMFLAVSTQAVFAVSSADLLISYDSTETKAELRAVRSVLAGSVAAGQIIAMAPRGSGGYTAAQSGLCVTYASEKARQSDVVTLKTINGLSSRLSVSCGY